MAKYIIGILVICLIYFFIKWTDYSSLTVTKGVVVSHGAFSYGSVHGLNRARDIVPYPIVKFEGPETTVRFSREITQAEFDSISIEIDNLGSITKLEADMIQTLMVDELRGKHKDSFITKNEYITETPWGAYFIGSYPIGDSMDVIYNEAHPSQGRAYSFFSYWLTLPAICILILLSLVYCGILIAANARGLH